MRLLGRNALITGGSRGIGLAIARKFAVEGASVTILARNKLLLNEELHRLPRPRAHEQRHGAFVYNVDEPISGLDLSDSFDILVNSAGIAQQTLTMSVKPEDVKHIVNTNLVGTITTTQALLKSMLKSKRDCSIVNISSVLGIKPVMGTAVYAATKSGVEAFTLGLAAELGSRNIRSNCLRLGLVDGGMGLNAGAKVKELFLGDSGSLISLETIADAALDLVDSDANGKVLEIAN